MATNNIKIFDENKGNIMSTEEYGTNSQRLNGVQQGIASSMLQNKTLYQLSLVAYAIGQMMVNNGLDANDDNAVSAFVGNLANTIVQKVVDKASTTEAQTGTDANKFMTPATTRAAINVLKATSEMATAGTDTTHWMTPALVKQMVNAGINTVPGIVNTYTKIYDQTISGTGNFYEGTFPSGWASMFNYSDIILYVQASAGSSGNGHSPTIMFKPSDGSFAGNLFRFPSDEQNCFGIIFAKNINNILYCSNALFSLTDSSPNDESANTYIFYVPQVKTGTLVIDQLHSVILQIYATNKTILG